MKKSYADKNRVNDKRKPYKLEKILLIIFAWLFGLSILIVVGMKLKILIH